MVVFADRVDAGRQLAARLEYLHGQDVVVLGLPRGGVPVAFEVAEALEAPLDVIVVRKLGVPFQPELAMGAIGEGGVEVLDDKVLTAAQVTEQQLHTVERRERALSEARVELLRRGRARIDLNGRIAIVVDDGIATGSTARAACEVARHLGAARVVLAVPVAPAETVRNLAEADEVVCVSVPRWFMAVGNHYRDFSPTSDDGVIVLLDAAARRMQGGQAVDDGTDCDIDVEIPVDTVAIQGHLHLPEPAAGVVLFAHGSGSGRHSPRNRSVASVLNRAGLGAVARLAHSGRGAQPRQRIRLGAAREPAHRGDPVARRSTRRCIVPRRILRCEHGSWRCAVGGGGGRIAGRCGRFARWPSGPGRLTTCPGAGPNTADRGQR